MGSKITDLRPMQCFCAEGAITLFMATYLGVPVSTTHTITGGIMNAGSAHRVSVVRWRARKIVVAWIVTMPASATIAAITYWISAPLF